MRAGETATRERALALVAKALFFRNGVISSMYELEYLQTYTGKLDPRDLNLAACFNSIEKHISQTEYQLKIRHPFAQNLKHITIKILNENIPHLIGLSKTHHLNLPITQPAIIFQKVKQQEENWTLQELIAADEG